MKIDFKRLNNLLEAKANRAIDRLDGLKCYTDEFQDTLDSIVYMLEVSKELEQYDTECPDCNHRNEQPQQPEYLGKPYKPFSLEYADQDRVVLLYSNGCQPCQYLKPILEEFVQENNITLELVLVDEAAGHKHAEQHQVQSWPTLFVVKNNIIEFVTFGADVHAPVEATKDRLNHEVLPLFI